MKFAHPKTQEVFESLSSPAQAIVRAAVYKQKAGEKGFLISHTQDVLRDEEDPYEALNEVLSKIRDGVFEVAEGVMGPAIRVIHPAKPDSQIADDAAALQAHYDRLDRHAAK